MATETQTLHSVPDPRIERTIATIVNHYVVPYGENGEPARVTEAAERMFRASLRTVRARTASGLQ